MAFPYKQGVGGSIPPSPTTKIRDHDAPGFSTRGVVLHAGPVKAFRLRRAFRMELRLCGGVAYARGDN